MTFRQLVKKVHLPPTCKIAVDLHGIRTREKVSVLEEFCGDMCVLDVDIFNGDVVLCDPEKFARIEARIGQKEVFRA